VTIIGVPRAQLFMTTVGASRNSRWLRGAQVDSAYAAMTRRQEKNMQQPRVEITLTFTSDKGDHKITTSSALDIEDVSVTLGTYARIRHRHLLAAGAAVGASRPAPSGGGDKHSA
jgi:hypothetical protein